MYFFIEIMEETRILEETSDWKVKQGEALELCMRWCMLPLVASSVVRLINSQ